MPLIPKLEEVVEAGAGTAIRRVWTSMPATVLTYDKAKQTADVRFVARNPLAWDDDAEIEFEDLPDLSDVHIVFPRGGGCSITFPLGVGDGVLVVFTTLSPAEWLASGSVGNPADTGRHTLSSAFAIAGVGPDTSPLTAVADDAIVLEAPTIKLGAMASEFVALAKKVDDKIALLALDVSTMTAMSISHPSAYSDPGSVAATKAKAE